jgi:hypothetical protein
MAHWIIINGPLWFAQALLIFCLGYCLWRTWRGPAVKSPDLPLPSGRAWLLSAIGVGATAFLIRQWVPTGVNIAGLQIGYFASYIFLFCLGCVAWRGDWLDHLTRSQARTWAIVSLCSIPLLPLTILLTVRFGGSINAYGGGWNLRALFYALWEPFVAWGIIAWLLVWFRERWNAPSRLWERLGQQAYTVYIIHPPVLVGVAVVMHHWAAPAIAKFAVTGTLTSFICVLFAAPLLSIPGIRRVL